MQKVPSLKKEPFITALDNYIAKIDFQLSTIRYSENDVRKFMQTWDGVSDTLLHKDYYYAKAFSNANSFLNDDVHAVTASASGKMEEAKKIYEFVRDNYTCTDVYPWMKQPLRKVYQSKRGNTAEINLLLAAMLAYDGFEVHPVLLSTTDNGKAYKSYPILEKYNYTICQLKIGTNKYLLDASNSKLGFNRLAADCYNGYARVIDQMNPELLNLSADSLKESKVTSVFIVTNKDHKLSASVSSVTGYQESLNMREEIAKESKEEFFKKLKKSYTGDVELTNATIDSLQLPDMPLKVSYDLQADFGDEDIVYFNPMLAEQQKDNPFAAAERNYPVEMPYCWDETYILNMQIPEGYTVDELPKPTRVKLNENEGMFEYLIVKNGDHIQLRSRVKLEKAVYEPDDYQTLRDFFAFVVKKEAEQIVFKKVK